VVILALDRPAETRAAIASALSQTGVLRHVFVVDQGSRPEALAQLAHVIGPRTDATLVSLQINHGVAAGRNVAASLGHGRIIVALDNDAEFADGTTLARMVSALDAEPDLAAIAARIVVHATGGDDLSSWGYPLALLPMAARSFETVTFVGAGHAIRRAAWDAAAGYDAALFFCWEEYDFCLRAIDRGWRVRYRGDIVVRHKVSAEQRVAWAGDRWFYFVRNRLYIERKWKASWLALAPRISGYLMRGVRNGHLRPTLRAITAAAALARRVQRVSLSPAAQDYLTRNDRAHRGSLLRRLRREVLRPLSAAVHAGPSVAGHIRTRQAPLQTAELAHAGPDRNRH
jgi:GT2 family glycosyltransferase